MNSKGKILLLIIILSLPYCPAFSQGWAQLIVTGGPSARRNASAIYDSTTNRMIVFGGITANGNVNDLWCLDLNTGQWDTIPSSSVSRPAPRHTHISMFDELGNRMLIWSGNGSALYNDVWAFNFNDSTWQELFPDGNVSGAPLKRYGVTTVFDPVSRNMVTFAGFTTSGRFDDTWSFNVDSMSWTDRTNLSFPLRRCLSSQSYAPDRRQMIIYGGQSTGNLDDIWTLDIDTYTWNDVTPAQNPIGRHFPSNVYCGNGNVVIFGGDSLNQGNTAGALNDIWAFSLDTHTWTALPHDSLGPSPRYGHTYIYIPQMDNMIIFGGETTGNLSSQTWVYHGIASFLNGVDDLSKNSTPLKLFPNPATDFIHIDLSDTNGEYQLEILNTFGEIIYESKNLNTIDMSHFSKGMYFIKIKQGKNTYTQKFIKGQ